MLARRVFPDGRTRAYAWGRSAAREDVAAAAERLVAMSGQFEQRRLARPAYQLDVLDAFAGEEQLRRRAALRVAWRELGAARRRHDELTRDAAAAEARLAELRALVEDTEGLEPDTEERLRAERERLRHVTELAEGAAAAGEALAPEDGDGAAGLVALAERALAPLERLAPELERAGNELRDVELRLRETASELRAFLASLEAEPDRLEQVESELDRIADARRRFRCETLRGAARARGRGARRARGARRRRRPAAAAAARRSPRPRRRVARARRASCAPRAARRAEPFAEAVAEELQGIGLGEGEFRVELREREPGRERRRRGRVPDPAERRACRSRRSPRPPRAASSRASRSRSPRSAAARRWSSTRSTPASAARPPTPSARRCAGWPSARRWSRSRTCRRSRSLADRHFRVEKVPGDPTHTPIEELDDDERRDELERMLGGEQFLAGRPAGAMSFVEFTGRRGSAAARRTSSRRLGPDDVAIIDHHDLDRVSAEELLESGVRVVVNVAQLADRPLPEPGPAAARARRRAADRRSRRAALRRAQRRRATSPSAARASSATAPASRTGARSARRSSRGRWPSSGAA